MAAKRMLKLSFVDSEGVCYHEDILGPRQARELLVRSEVFQVKIAGHNCPLHCLTFADAKRQSRAITAKLSGPLGGEVIITPNE